MIAKINKRLVLEIGSPVRTLGVSFVVESIQLQDLLEPGDDPVPLPSAVNLDSIESVSIAILVERLGRLGDPRMREICAALAVAVDCPG